MRALRAAGQGLGLVLVAGCWLLACAEKRAPPLGDDPLGTAGKASGTGGLMLSDAGSEPTGPCGEQRIPAIENPPNLGFIVDRSGSMSDILVGSGLSKYENARIALSKVLRAVGHRVNYGVTVFPGLDGATGCEPGTQLMGIEPGDDPRYAREGVNGPRLKDMLIRLSTAGVEGGTPVAGTLNEALVRLSAVSGDTYAVLITDGAPNCNAELECDADGCIPNIEGLSYRGLNCTHDVNCCSPKVNGPGANISCIDDQASIDAVAALAAAGVRTFVVGMPGSEPYEALLDTLAEVGGTARSEQPKYFPVTDTEELEKSLKGIAAAVAISCELALDYEPKDPSYVNLYFDDQVVEYDEADGWVWTDDGRVSIRGMACEQLSRGDVLEVQILAGCKTQVK